MHVDLMHVFYSRVMGRGRVITKYSRGGGELHVCICDKTHNNYSAVIIEVYADMYMACRGMYTKVCNYIGGSGGMPPQGKFEFLVCI